MTNTFILALPKPYYVDSDHDFLATIKKRELPLLKGKTKPKELQIVIYTTAEH